MTVDGLGDRPANVDFVSVDEDTGVTLIDAPDATLPHLRKKVEWFGDDSKVTKKKQKRRSAPLIAPISGIRLASLYDRAGPAYRESRPSGDRDDWIEIACRGGRQRSEQENNRTRIQIQGALKVLHKTEAPEYMAAERLVFLVRLSVPNEVEFLIDHVDCIFEFDLAGPDVVGWLNHEQQPLDSANEMNLIGPRSDAPSVAIHDTGLTPEHPLLRRSIKQVVSVVPGDVSTSDEDGHGTEMAGIALFDDLASALQSGNHEASHWLESARILVAADIGTARESYRHLWPKITEDAVIALDEIASSQRIHVMAVTAEALRPGEPSYWSDAVDQLCYNEGVGRLFIVSAGNADYVADTSLLDDFPQMNLEAKHHDPAQAVNALTIGAYTERESLPPDPTYSACVAVARAGQISPHTTAGTIPNRNGIKPDVVLEGGNVAYDGTLPDGGVGTLVGLTTSHRPTVAPFSQINGTSEAAAHAAWFAAQLVRHNPEFRPETIRGLIVHAASWSERMCDSFPNVDERLAICGFGVPDLSFASGCAASRATIIVEDEMPNFRRESSSGGSGNSGDGGNDREFFRVAKIFNMPFPEYLLLESPDAEIEIRVTLSYFAEPNTARRVLRRGLDLRWDMQGPLESVVEFTQRINRLARADGEKGPGTDSFGWGLGMRRRSRGTVQSDRWRGTAADAAGAKKLAVYPRLGWWDQKQDKKFSSMPFSLIVSVESAGLDLYNSVALELAAEVTIDA